MMFNKENAIDASKLHVDSFKYQSTEDMPNEIYEFTKLTIINV